MRFTPLKPKGKIKGGAGVPHFKNTAESVTERMPAPEKVYILLQQHIGAPCSPVVKVGDQVFVGTKIGDSEAYVSAPIHSSVSGKVSKIDEIKLSNGKSSQVIVIENDFKMETDPNIKPFRVKTQEDLINAAKLCGLVGLGGAGFPTHVKLAPNKELDTLIINAAECEPYITADYRECMEKSGDIIDGIKILQKIFKFKRVVIGIEDNKPKAIKNMIKGAIKKRTKYCEIEVIKLRACYPQGAEKMLIYSATKRKLPLGKLPSDVGCMVMNVTSVAVLNRFIKTGMPLVERRVTVDGDVVANPKNVYVPLGTPIKDIIDFCGGFKSDYKKIVLGGPMMGTTVMDINMPISKQNNAIIALSEKRAKTPQEYNCINCGRCAKYCPMNLVPGDSERAVQEKSEELLLKLNADYCMECGSCSFACPSRRKLTQYMRLAKIELQKIKAKGGK